ncbi:16202_t:CDS:2 [Acaulospora morrowiae]|uniref:16202_t:CDS:1 n=1 Tax=Acaulospora morrowiae TaxID=94023 RepID=A0A9N9CLM8_9GLOM|nr:16202_t:CDS:2 [Acaulospora morrowiae]
MVSSNSDQIPMTRQQLHRYTDGGVDSKNRAFYKISPYVLVHELEQGQAKIAHSHRDTNSNKDGKDHAK